jgi:hypothetical protein
MVESAFCHFVAVQALSAALMCAGFDELKTVFLEEGFG